MNWRRLIIRAFAISLVLVSLIIALFLATSGGVGGMDRGMDRPSDHRGLSE